MLKNEVVQTMSLNIKFSYLAENSKFSRSNSYFSILTPTFLRDGFLNSCFQNPSENSAYMTKWVILHRHFYTIMNLSDGFEPVFEEYQNFQPLTYA